MKVNRARRFWWRLMYDDPYGWGIWRLVAWAIPAGMVLALGLAWWYGRIR